MSGEGSAPKNGAGKYVKPFANITAGGGEIAKILNRDQNAIDFNSKRRAEAAKEMNPEITTSLNAIKELVNQVISTTKSTIKLPFTLATEVVSHAIAFPVNIARGIWDRTMRVLGRAGIAIIDLIPEKTFGKVSQTVGQIRRGTHSRIDKTLGWMDNLAFKTSPVHA